MIGYRANPERTLRSIRAEIDGPIHGQWRDRNPLPARPELAAVHAAAQAEAEAYHAWCCALYALDHAIESSKTSEAA